MCVSSVITCFALDRVGTLFYKQSRRRPRSKVLERKTQVASDLRFPIKKIHGMWARTRTWTWGYGTNARENVIRLNAKVKHVYPVDPELPMCALKAGTVRIKPVEAR